MIPKVVIIGRPNVGKSSLFNLLAGRMVSIVDPTAGVTRDRVAQVVELPGEPARIVELVDTGGYGIQDAQGLTAQVEQQIAYAIAEAHLILFVVDAQTGIVPLDSEVARLLRRSGVTAPVLLIANKVDGASHEPGAHEAARLGFGEPIMVSAMSQHNKWQLIESIRDTIDFETLGAQQDRPDTGILMAIVGKRNAGKSTLVNALAGQERVIVSEIEGTTRDSIDVRFEINGKVFTAIDTAGVRRSKSVKEDIEYYSTHRSLRSIRRADVVLMLIDATVPVSQVDEHVEREVLTHFKPVVIVVNKWDLAQDKSTQEEYIKYLEKALGGLTFAPVAFISAANNEGVRDLLAMALNLHEQAGHRVATAELNRITEAIVQQHQPPAKGGRQPRLYYVTQLAVHPPTIGLFVNDPQLFDNSYQRYLLNRYRDVLPFSEVPIQLLVRARRKSELPDESHE